MATFNDKVRAKSAVRGKVYPHDMSHAHISTTDYYKLGVSMYLEVPEKNELEFQAKSFCMAEPGMVPTFGRCTVHQKLYYVPYHLVQASWNKFRENKPFQYDKAVSSEVQVNTQIPTKARTAYLENLQSLLFQRYTVSTDADNYDMNAPGLSTKYNFTPMGKHIYNLLWQLGIKVPMAANPGPRNNFSNQLVNMNNVLALAKILYDHYYTKKYETRDKSDIEYLLNTRKYGLEELGTNELEILFDFLEKSLFYNNDYFTACWDNPVGPNSLGSQITIRDNTTQLDDLNNEVTTLESNGTPIVQSLSNQLYQFSQYMDSVLKRVTDYVQRNRIAGTSALNRFLLHFGIVPKSETINESVEVGDYSYDIDFSAIYANADTAATGGEVLGSYAGKGEGGNRSSKIIYNTEEYGVYIMVQYMIPRIGYYQGMDRSAYHINRFDFWTAEFDNLGVQAVSQSELFVQNKQIKIGANVVGTDGTWNGVFGYLPRYADMKMKNDYVSGEFIFGSGNVGMNAWHLMREINPVDYAVDVSEDETPNYQLMPVHNFNFINTWNDRQQYDRNFSQSKVDNFKVVNVYNIECRNQMKPVYDNYEWDNEGRDILIKLDGGR